MTTLSVSHRAVAAALIVASVYLQSAKGEEPVNLASNGNFEVSAKTPGWPDDWAQLKAGGSWETEDGNHFLRMTSTTPGSMVMLYRQIAIPAGATALDLNWRQRVTNLKLGVQAWFDARIMMEFQDAAGAKVSPAPSAPYVRKDTGGWQEKSMRLTVPEGAVLLKFMPALLQVESGTFDLDDIVIKVAPAVVQAAESGVVAPK
jgi:endoglucanase